MMQRWSRRDLLGAARGFAAPARPRTRVNGQVT
jgi:hypothetical protein